MSRVLLKIPRCFAGRRNPLDLGPLTVTDEAIVREGKRALRIPLDEIESVERGKLSWMQKLVYGFREGRLVVRARDGATYTIIMYDRTGVLQSVLDRRLEEIRVAPRTPAPPA